MVTDIVNDKNIELTTTNLELTTTWTTITTKTTRPLATMSPLNVVIVVIVVVCNREKESGGRKKICVICVICVTINILTMVLHIGVCFRRKVAANSEKGSTFLVERWWVQGVTVEIHKFSRVPCVCAVRVRIPRIQVHPLHPSSFFLPLCPAAAFLVFCPYDPSWFFFTPQRYGIRKSDCQFRADKAFLGSLF